MATELEIKLSVSEANQVQAFKWLAACPEVQPGKETSLINRYFDTAGADLNRAKAALRVRKAGEAYIQTLKTRGDFVEGAHRREEWEWPVPGAELDLSLLEETPLSRQLDLSQLNVVFETNFQRQVLWLEEPQSLIEIAVDSGRIVSNGASRPLHEVEFELKNGDGAKLVLWALALAREVPVFLNLVSKAEQGYFLAGIYQPDTPESADALSITGFLEALSICWLLNQPFSARDHDLSSVAEAAALVGCSDLWDDMIAEFSQGVDVRELAEKSTKLGVLQLQLAAAASN